MANTYTYSGPATRWSEGDPTAVDYLNVSRVNSDHLYEALNTILVTSGVTSGATSTLVSNTETNTQSPGNSTARLATTAFVAAAVTAGSTPAAGDNTQVQYNNSDAFGASGTFTFVTPTLTLFGPAGGTGGILNLSTNELTVVDGDSLGHIDFQAPIATPDTDSRAVAAKIHAEADATFSAILNETDLVFSTATSGAVSEKFRITSDGELGLSGANYGTDGYVITSTGAGTAVAWEAIPSPEVSAVLQRTVATGLDITAETGQNASKIILVDLTDPATMWDVEAFLAATRFTSWRVELGAPPMRGAMFIINDTTELKWWNLDTNAVYATFESASNDMFIDAVNLFFLDGVLYVAVPGAGLIFIDFLSDKSSLVDATNWNYYAGNINERNDAKGYVKNSADPNLVNAAINSTVAYRHATLVDEFDRPKHWWMAGTDSGPNVYNPADNAIYTAEDGMHTDGAAIADGAMWMTQDFPADPTQIVYYFIENFDANSTPQNRYFAQPLSTVTTGSQSINFFTSAWVPTTAIGAYGKGAAGAGIGVIGSNQGLLFAHIDPTSKYDGGLILVTSTYQTPYMKGRRGGAYPLNDLIDRSGNGLDMVNSATPATLTTGPFGANTAYDFNGSNNMLLTAHNAAQLGTNKLTVSCWFNPDAASGEEALVAKQGTNYPNEHDWMLTVFGDDMRFVVYSGNTAYIGSGVTLTTGLWYHAAGVYDGEYVTLYLNGVRAGTRAALTANMDTDNVGVAIGAETNNAHNFNGKISQVSIQMAAWTETEVNLEYQRMLRALEGAVHTLTDDAVDSVRTDPQTGLTAVCVDGQVEIWNAELGLRESIDAVDTGATTLHDADVRLPEGADEPLYAMGRTGRIDVVAPNRRLLG